MLKYFEYFSKAVCQLIYLQIVIVNTKYGFDLFDLFVLNKPIAYQNSNKISIFH